jgi:circadian clock protein KaiB
MSSTSSWSEKMPRLGRLSLRLYVAGSGPRAEAARANLRTLCAELAGRPPRIDIVDVFQQPERTILDAIIVTPTLVRLSPKPVLKILGTLSDLPRVRLALGIPAPSEKNTSAPTAAYAKAS